MRKSTIGFDSLDTLKSKKPVISNPDIYKSGVDKQYLDSLSEKEVSLLEGYIKFGMQKKNKVKTAKVSLVSLRIIVEVLFNRKLETDELLFNTSDSTLRLIGNLPRTQQTKVWEILGTYRYNIAHTINELNELKLIKGNNKSAVDINSNVKNIHKDKNLDNAVNA